jgi:hypothetical protein
MAPTQKSVVLIGPVEPIVQSALLAAWIDRMTLHVSGSRGHDLIAEARSVGARAIVLCRDDLNDLCGEVPDDITMMGVSIASFDVLVCRGSEVEHFTNPDPERIADIIDRALRN